MRRNMFNITINNESFINGRKSMVFLLVGGVNNSAYIKELF